jgi:chloramphenicol 3-O phosphotransferase
MSGSGKLILINGTSSAGKTSLAQALQRKLEPPFYRASIDTFVHNMLDWPRDVVIDPPEGTWHDGFSLRTLDDSGQRMMVLTAGTRAQRFLTGMRAAIATFVKTGNSLIFDDVLYHPAFLRDYLRAFEGVEVWFVGLRCPLDVLEQRERARGDRMVGHARGHYDLVHQHGLYDIEIDTAQETPESAAAFIATRLRLGTPSAFLRLRQNLG